MKHTTSRERRTVIKTMQRRKVATAIRDGKDVQRRMQPRAREISRQTRVHLPPDKFFAACKAGYRMRVRPDGEAECYLPVGEVELILDGKEKAAPDGNQGAAHRKYP